MAKSTTHKPLTLILGTAFTLSLANTGVSQAAENPFSMQPVSAGNMMLAESKGVEGKCGEGKCGGNKKSKKLMKHDTDGDGKVSKDEYMSGQESRFDRLDTNSDGYIDSTESKSRKKKKQGS